MTVAANDRACNVYLYYFQSVPATVVCSCTLNLFDIRNESHRYDMAENVPINQTGLRIQIKDDGSTNLNRLFYGTVTLTNNMETNVSNGINFSKYKSHH